MKVIAIVSGGMDSATLVAHLLVEGHDVETLSFDYGQRHAEPELRAARTLYSAFKHETVLLDSFRNMIEGGASSLMNRAVAVPEGHYEDPAMAATIVPNRNMVMLSIAAGVAIARGRDAVAYGAHVGDRAVYPDCRLEFVEAAREILRLCHTKPIELLTPFVTMQLDKSGVCALGARLGTVDFGRTWTCYKGLALHCGKCGACVERREAFEVAGIPDPTEYAS